MRPLLGRWVGGRSIRSIAGGGSYQDLKLPPTLSCLGWGSARKNRENILKGVAVAHVCVHVGDLSVRELWFSPSHKPHIYTRTRIHCPTTYTQNTRGPGGLHVYPETTVARDADRVERKPRKIPKEGRPEEKKLYVQLPIPPTPRESGIPLASQRLPFSPSARGSKFFMWNELISFFRLKKKKLARRYASSWGKKRRIKNREMNANTFYILQEHTFYAPLACFLRKLVELFCRKSSVVHLFECTFQ